VNLEKFVLNKQQNYSVMKKRFEANKELSVESIKKANLLELEIQKLKDDIKKLNRAHIYSAIMVAISFAVLLAVHIFNRRSAAKVGVS
jgi:hypothetical protein